MVVFFFLLKMSTDIQKAKLEKDVSNVMEQMSNTRAITYYIELCLKQSAENSIYRLGKGGLRIYDDVNGSSSKNDYPFMTVSFNDTVNTSFDTSYLMTKSKLDSNPFYGIPWYPEKAESYNFILPNKLNFYPLGNVLLPSICDINGPNSFNVNVSVGKNCDIGNTLWYPYSNLSDTIQIQLEDYTSYLFLKCVDKNYLSSSFGRNISIEKPNTTVIFGESDVIFNVNIPIDISVLKSKSSKSYYTSTRIYNVETNVPVRLKRDYEFISDAIYSDTKYLSFDLRKNYNTLNSFNKLNYITKNISFSVNEYGNNVHFVNFIDYGSSVFGSPFQMIFFMENRLPILNWTHLTSSQDYDIVVYANDKIVIDAKGFDPDDEELFYFYEGWQETESYEMDKVCCAGPIMGWKPICLLEKPFGCVTKNNTAPHLFTSSPEYILSNQTVSYQTDLKDVGEHNLTLYLCDIHSKDSINKSRDCDYQVIRILVDDLDQVIPEAYNNFNDINTTYASIEDLYTLDASHQIGIITNPVGPFTWCDALDFPDCFTVGNSIFILPNKTTNVTDKSRLIQDIHKSGYIFNTNKTHNITLQPGVSGGHVPNIEEISVNVLNCLPHKDFAASFPFNNFSGDNDIVSYTDNPDPFMADHTCCMDGTNGNYGDYFSSSKSCYNFVSYGGFWSFNDSRFTSLKTDETDFSSYDVTWQTVNLAGAISKIKVDIHAYTNVQNYPYNYSGVNKYNTENDVYKREFDTYCRGDRGNICDNNPNETRTVVGNCGDVMAIWQTEKCSGPSNLFMKDKELKEEDVIGNYCSDYGPGDSFDKLLRTKTYLSNDYINHEDSADGQCGETYRCSDVGVYNDPSKNSIQSNFLAKGLCDGSGGCNAYDNSNNGTKYNNASWDSDNTIDCRCFARSSKDGSGGILGLDNEALIIPFDAVNLGGCTNGQIYSCGQNAGVDACVKNVVSGAPIQNTWQVIGGSTYLRKYLAYDKDGACGTNEMCGTDLDLHYTDIDPDDDSIVCSLSGNNYLNIYDKTKGYPSNERICCGDDNGEALRQTTTFSGGVLLNFCKLANECVLGNGVYNDGTALDINSDSNFDYCLGGNWYDCKADGDCSADKWCVQNNGIDVGQSLGKPIFDCVAKLALGSQCNRDSQCNVGKFCKFNAANIKVCSN